MGSPVPGDAELTDLLPDLPMDYARTDQVSLTFVEGGATDTITRAGGSFVTDGWKVGMKPRAVGTASNDDLLWTLVTVVALTLTLTATSDDVTAETITCDLVSQNKVPGDNTSRAPV